MPRAGKSPQERARIALGRLDAQGGRLSLPLVLRSRDVRPLMGRDWFTDALRLGGMPGVQIERGGAWRCERETFIDWLIEVADGTAANMALGARSGPAHGRIAGHDQEEGKARAGADPAVWGAAGDIGDRIGEGALPAPNANRKKPEWKLKFRKRRGAGVP